MCFWFIKTALISLFLTRVDWSGSIGRLLGIIGMKLKSILASSPEVDLEIYRLLLAKY